MQQMNSTGRLYSALSTSQIRPEYQGFSLYPGSVGWLLHLPSCHVKVACLGDLLIRNENFTSGANRGHMREVVELMADEGIPPGNSRLANPVKHFVYELSDQAWAQELCKKHSGHGKFRCHPSGGEAFAAIKQEMLEEALNYDPEKDTTPATNYWTEVVADCPVSALVGIVLHPMERKSAETDQQWVRLAQAIGDRLVREVPQLSGRDLPIAWYSPGEGGPAATRANASLEVAGWVAAGGDQPLAGGGPLVEAARSGDLEALEEALATGEGGGVDRDTDGLGLTALMTASAWGHTPVVKRLLEKGADPKLKGQVFDQMKADGWAQVFDRLTADDWAQALRHMTPETS